MQIQYELATEEPLEISLEYGETGQPQTKSIPVTMRTPGNDAELTLRLINFVCFVTRPTV